MDKLLNWWNNLPYAQRGALIRGARAFAALVVSVLISLLAAGLLFPATWSVGTVTLLTLILSPILQGIDKYLRENEAAKEEVKQTQLAQEHLDSGAVTDNPSGE